eukprot:6507417-Heterocapsa_arctica.AAC.1
MRSAAIFLAPLEGHSHQLAAPAPTGPFQSLADNFPQASKVFAAAALRDGAARLKPGGHKPTQ